MEESLRSIIGKAWKKIWTDMGNKLKILAQVICIIGVIISLVQAIQVWSIKPVNVSAYFGNANVHLEQDSTFWLGLWTLLQDCALTLVIAFVLYGFGIIVGFVENGGSISPKGISVSDGGTASTWICPDCKTENPKNATRCQECGAFRKVSE